MKVYVNQNRVVVDNNKVVIQPKPFSIAVATTTTPQDFKLYLSSPTSLLIDWGDTNQDIYSTTGLKTHAYALPGTYTVTFVSGTTGLITFNNTSFGATPLLLTSVLTAVPAWLGLILATRMFQGCTNIASWPAHFFDAASANVSTFYAMFYQLSSFNEDLSGWSVANVTTADYMLESTSFSQANYDKLLVSWAAQNVKNDVPFRAGSAKYSAGAPADARAVLVGKGWSITDGGPA